MNLVLLGPPGAGKGTLANLLKASLNLTHVSTGDILREEMKNGTELGREAKKNIERGELVPDELVTRIIRNRIVSQPSSACSMMFDGFPRTVQQAEALKEILDSVHKPLDCVLYMEASTDLIIRRITGRRICKNCGHVYHVKNRPPKTEGICDNCGSELYQRPDDNEETVKKRMAVYLKNTQPIIDYYRQQGILTTIDGDRESEDLHDDIMAMFNESGKCNTD